MKLAEKIGAGNLSMLLECMGGDCPPLQFVREITLNEIQAIQQRSNDTSEPIDGIVVWQEDPRLLDEHGLSKLSCLGNGNGMTEEDIRKYLNGLGSSKRKQGKQDNFGVGVRISAAPRNPAGLVYLTWHEGVGSVARIIQDAYGNYGLAEQANGKAVIGTSKEDKPPEIDQHGTCVILMGTDDADDTTKPPPGAAKRNDLRWLLRYLNLRFYQFPMGVDVFVRIKKTRGDKTETQKHQARGQRYMLDRHSTPETRGVVEVSEGAGASIHWWILSPRKGGGSTYEQRGHTATLFQDELFEMRTGRAGITVLQSFGIVFGYANVVIYVEPHPNPQLKANTQRIGVRIDGKSLPWELYRNGFLADLPDPLLEMMRKVASEHEDRDHQKSVEEKLQEILAIEYGKFMKKRTAKRLTLAEDCDEGMADLPLKDPTTGGSGGGGEGQTKPISSLSIWGNAEDSGVRLVEQEGEKKSLPGFAWVKSSDGSRMPPHMDDRAACYIDSRDMIQANWDFRGYKKAIDRLVEKFKDHPNIPSAVDIRPVIEDRAKHWWRLALVQAVVMAKAMNGSQWTRQDKEVLTSQETLTLVVLEDYWLRFALGRDIGNSFGKYQQILEGKTRASEETSSDSEKSEEGVGE